MRHAIVKTKDTYIIEYHCEWDATNVGDSTCKVLSFERYQLKCQVNIKNKKNPDSDRRLYFLLVRPVRGGDTYVCLNMDYNASGVDIG